MRSIIIGTAIAAFMAVVQLLAALVSPEFAIGGGLLVGLLAVGVAKFFRSEFENRWAIVLVALLGSLAGVGLALAAGVAGPTWMLAIAPPLAIVGAGVLQLGKGGGGKRCGLCERRVGGPRFECPRCGLLVGEQCCWVHDRLRCRLCEQNGVPAFPPDARWWDRNFGPRLDRGRCQITMEDAKTADLRACPRCGRPQSRTAWDLNNGECARCGWCVQDMPERLRAYMLQ